MTEFIARKKYKPWQLAMDKIRITYDMHYGVKYAIVHYLNNSNLFGRDYDPIENLEDLNSVKSKIINHGFKIYWDLFNKAMRHIS